MIEDRPISQEEDKILRIVRKYSGGNPYATVTYNQITSDDWKAFSGDIVRGIIGDYLKANEVDYIRLRWFFRRLAQVGHPGALQVTIDHIRLLEPCLPSVCSYINSIQSIPPDDWKKIGKDLLGFIEPGSMFNSEFARLSLLSLFSKNEYIDHFVKLAPVFGASDPYARREILLAARTNAETDWLREHKESFELMDPWQRMAFIYCVSILPRDERNHFLKGHWYLCPFDEELVKWSRNT